MTKSQVGGLFSMFCGSLLSYNLIRYAVGSWSAILDSGILAFGVILFIAIFTMVGIGIFLLGLILFKVDFAPGKTMINFKKKMKSLGFGDPYKVIVYGDDDDNATSVYRNFHYRYFGKNYRHNAELKATGEFGKLSAKLPFFIRFSSVVDAVTGHIIVHDGYNNTWYLFENSNYINQN